MFNLVRGIFICICVSVVFSACTETPQGNKYFPLQKGLQWKYKITTSYLNETLKSELSIKSLGKIKFDDKHYFIRRTSTGIDYLINQTDDGVFREGLRTIVELNPRLDSDRRYILRYPLEAGTNWRENSQPMVLMNVFPFKQKITGIHFPISYQIESVSETVSVAAGNFTECIKVTGYGVTEIYTDAVNGFNEIPIKVEEWYAPNIGLIKQVRYEMDGEVIKISDTPAYYGGNTVLELVSFDVD